MNIKQILKKTRKIFIRILIGMIVLIGLLFIAIHLPFVQNFLTNKTEKFLEKKLKTEVNIDKIRFTVWNSILIEGIYVEDNAQDTLAYLGGLDLNYSIAKLLQKKIQFKSLSIYDLYVNADQDQEASNFKFILDAFGSDTTAVEEPKATPDPSENQGNPWVLILKDTPLNVRNLDFNYHDFDLLIKAKIGTLEAEIPEGDILGLQFDINDFLLDKADLLFKLPAADTAASDASTPLLVKLNKGDIRNTKANIQMDGLLIDGKISDFHVENLLVDQNTDLLSVAAENIKLKDSDLRYAQGQNIAASSYLKNFGDLEDNRKSSTKKAFDYSHINLQDIKLNLDKLRYDSIILLNNLALKTQEVQGEKVAVQANSVQIKLPYQFDLEAVKLNYAKTALDIPKANVTLPANDAQGNLPLNGILFDILTNDSYAYLEDVAYFVPELRKSLPKQLLSQKIDLKIVAQGSPDKIDINSLLLQSPDLKTDLTGKLENTLDLNKTKVELNIKQLDVAKSIVGLLPKNSIPDSLNLPDKIMLRGKLQGKLSNINTNLRLNTFRYLSNSEIVMQLEGKVQRLLDFPKTSFNLSLKELRIPKSEMEILPPPGTIPTSISLPEQLLLSGTFKGKITALNYDLLLDVLRADSKSRITSSGLVTGLTVAELPTIDAKLQANPISQAELLAYLPDSLLPSYVYLPKIETVNLDFKGTPKDFAANGVLNTNATTATFKGNMRDSIYKVNLELKEILPTVLVDTVMLDSLLGFIPLPFDLFVNVNGSGFDWKNDMRANFNLSLVNKKDESDLDFVLGGQVNKGIITSRLTIDETYLKLKSQQEANFRGTVPIFDLSMDLEEADFREIPMVPLEFKIATRINGRVEGISLDNIKGNIVADSLIFWAKEENYKLDSVVIKANLKNRVNKLFVASDVLDVDLEGEFDLNNIAQQLQDQFLPYFTDAATGKTSKDTSGQADINLVVDLKDPTLFTDILVPGLEEISPFQLVATLDHVQQKAKVSTDIHRIRYQGIQVDTLSLNVIADQNDFNYDLLLSSAKVNESIQIDRFRLSGYLDQGEVYSSIVLKDEAEKEKYKLQFSFKQVDDGILLRLSPSQNVNYEPWEIAPENELLYTKNGITTKSFRLGNKDQAIEITGLEEEAAKLILSRINLSVINAFSPVEDLAGGHLSGIISLDFPLENLAVDAELEVEKLEIQKSPLGDLAIKTTYQKDKVNAVVKLVEGGNTELLLTADADLGGEEIKYEGALTLDVGLSRFGNVTEAFLNSATGRLIGDVKFKGTPTAPQVNGEIYFKESNINLALTNSTWKLGEQKMIFDKNTVAWKGFTLTDVNQQVATLNASLVLNSFEQIPTTATLSAKNFLLLNTNEDSGSDYYGKLLADVQANISGNLFTPKAIIEVKTLETSAITYVVSSGTLGLESDVGIVEWIDFDADSTEIKKTDKQSTYLMPFAISAEIKVNIAEDLQLKVITDTYTGDFFEGKAKGDLIVGYEQATDDLKLVGSVRLEEGSYRFSYEEIIRKKFKMRPGGTLRWTGDPVAPILDLDVFLEARTSPIPLVQMFDPDNTTTPRRPQIFQGTLHIRGDVNQPTITTELVFPDEGNSRSPEVEAAVARVNEDQSLADRQVFGLILFGGFIADSGPSSGNSTTDAVLGNLNQIVTQQLNNLASRYVNFIDLNLGVDSYTDEDNKTQADFQIGISKSFLDDRLSIQVDGVASTGNTADNSSSPAYIKDVIVEYKLTKKGGLKIKLYSEQEYNEYIGNEGIKTAGLLIFSADFKKFKLLLKKK